MTERTERWASDDGVELRLAHAAPEGEARANVLVVHGFAEHGGRYGALAHALAAAGMASCRVDLRGHGLSPGPRALVDDAGRHVRDVVGLLERLQAGPCPVALLGHSFGGAIAARAAQERPDLLDALVLSSPYLVTALDDPPWLLRLADRLSRVAPRLRSRRIPADVISRLPEEVRRYQEDPLVDHGGVRLASSRELHALAARVLADAHRLVTPALVVYGSADRLAHPDGARRLAADAEGEDVTLRIVEGGYHELLNDADGERVLRGIVDWLLDRLGALEA